MKGQRNREECAKPSGSNKKPPFYQSYDNLIYRYHNKYGIKTIKFSLYNKFMGVTSIHHVTWALHTPITLYFERLKAWEKINYSDRKLWRNFV